LIAAVFWFSETSSAAQLLHSYLDQTRTLDHGDHDDAVDARLDDVHDATQ
jgi:hypothetical protein